jgi:hypothetical protein
MAINPNFGWFPVIAVNLNFIIAENGEIHVGNGEGSIAIRCGGVKRHSMTS